MNVAVASAAANAAVNAAAVVAASVVNVKAVAAVNAVAVKPARTARRARRRQQRKLVTRSLSHAKNAHRATPNVVNVPIETPSATANGAARAPSATAPRKPRRAVPNWRWTAQHRKPWWTTCQAQKHRQQRTLNVKAAAAVAAVVAATGVRAVLTKPRAPKTKQPRR